MNNKQNIVDRIMNALYPAPKDCVCVQAKSGFSGNALCGDKHWFEGDREYICTREPGHEGNHVACGLGDHKIAHWPNVAKTTKTLSAFTLVELLIAIAIAVILMSFVAQACRAHDRNESSNNQHQESVTNALPPRIVIQECSRFRDVSWNDHSVFLITDTKTGTEFIIITGDCTVRRITHSSRELEK